MTRKRQEQLLQRLDEIGASVARSGNGLAVIGLGSVGTELERLDDYSDLDFFVIVQPGYKSAYLDDLSWLTDLAPVAYCFRNTVDGYKLLYQDDIFCEFAVFAEAELANIAYTGGRIIWKADGVDDNIRQPDSPPGQKTAPTVEWLLGEALTCLYVGLGRYHRGEKLSAQRFIQHYAVDRVLELMELETTAVPLPRDPFAVERRYEQRFPDLARQLPQFIQGYDYSRESAQALLAFLDHHFTINQALKSRILALSTGAAAPPQIREGR
jgi:lincosamide nucleotidyltransferase B/F